VYCNGEIHPKRAHRAPPFALKALKSLRFKAFCCLKSSPQTSRNFRFMKAFRPVSFLERCVYRRGFVIRIVLKVLCHAVSRCFFNLSYAISVVSVRSGIAPSANPFTNADTERTFEV
jgi:hypothetical protein